MNEALRQLVIERGQGRCEYCHFPQRLSLVPLVVDHIVAVQHRGKTVSGNLALSCFFCNASKGPNIASIDSHTGKLVRLFHPRRHSWSFHFHWDGPYLVGRTPIGRVTVEVLGINGDHEVELRRRLLSLGDCDFD